METELEDIWYNWLGTSYRQIGFLKSITKTEKDAGTVVVRKKPVSKVEEHINNLTESLTKTRAALERAGEAEEEARREHAGCSQALARQENENIRLEQDISQLYEEIESCHWKQGSDAVEQERLGHRIRELMADVRRAEEDAEENRSIMDNERLIHLQDREALRVVQTEHEDCLASLRVAQDILSEYSRDVAYRDATIQELKRHKSRMASKLSHFTSSLRTTAKELNDTKKRLAHVSEQLMQAEHIIETHFTMVSSLETYKQKLTEELDHLRSSYERRTLQLVAMREGLQERNSIIAELREQLDERDCELEATKLEAISAEEQLAATKEELAVSRNETACAENDMNDIKDYYTKLNAEKAHQLMEMDHEKNYLEDALNNAHQENSHLRCELANAAIEAAAQEDKLSQEIAAHGRTTEAAAAQKLRLQNSIENLRSDLHKANGDLRRTRETLFALNEKCHNLARAQVSLSSYRAKSRLLVDKEKSPERLPSTIEESLDSSSDNCFDDDSVSVTSTQHTNDQGSSDVNVAFMLRVKAQEQAIDIPQQSSDNPIEDTASQSTASTSTTEGRPLRIALPARDSFMEPLQVTSPKSVRFSLASDEGYQTDEDKAATSDGQIWSIITDLDRARKGYKVLRKRQRRRNLKTETCASQ